MHKTVIDKGRDAAFKDIAKCLLENGSISAVFVLKKFEGAKVPDYGLITEPGLIDSTEPFYPVMPQNAGQTMSKFTAADKPVLAMIRPCEYRAFVEMVKREQGSFDTFIIATYTCGGVIPLKDHAAGINDDDIKKYNESVEKGVNPDNIRVNCKRCTYFYPDNADILFSALGSGCGSTEIYVNDKGKEALSGLSAKFEKGEFDPASLKGIIEERDKEKKAQFAEIDKSSEGLEGLVEIFGRCIGCRGCNSVCPICYCTHCDFASANFDYNRTILEKELDQKGALRLPPDTMFFHIGRMSHMAFSCVGCGQCSDVCPADIPVGTVFNRSGEIVAADFDFVPGRSAEEKIPVMIYKEQEFPELGE